MNSASFEQNKLINFIPNPDGNVYDVNPHDDKNRNTPQELESRAEVLNNRLHQTARNISMAVSSAGIEAVEVDAAGNPLNHYRQQ